MDHAEHQHDEHHQHVEHHEHHAHASPPVEEGGGTDKHPGHDMHAGHDPDAFRRQFWIVLALTIPVVIWSEEVQMWLGYTAPTFPGS